MNTKNIQKLPDSELDVMLVLWSYDRPVMIRDIYNDFQTIRPCSKSAIHTLVDHLLHKGFIKIEMSDDKQSHKMITPLVSEEDYRRSAADKFVTKACRGSWQKLIAALVETNNLSEDDIDELTALLNKKGR